MERKPYEPPRAEDMTYEQALETLVKFSKEDSFAGEIVRGFMRVDPNIAATIKYADSDD